MDLTNIQPAYGDSLYVMLGALVLFLVFFLVYLWRAGWGRRGGKGRRFSFRSIPGYDATNEGLARAAERGRAVHTSPGVGGVGGHGIQSAATLAGMSLVESMARVAAITGAPVQATTNDAIAFALTDNALRRGYQRAGWSLESESGGARFLTHNDPLAYVAGAAEVAESQQVSHAVMAGQFGTEVLILTEAQRRSGAQQIIGSTDHQGLALLSITADNTLIGEDIFASGTSLERRTTNSASLLALDGLRWAVIVLIIAGVILVNIFGKEWSQVLTLLP
jgi:hypothetical protein